MGIGASLFLIALGAILTFALDVSISGLDLDVVGWILMVVGALGMVLTLTIWSSRRRPAVTTAPTERRVIEETRDTAKGGAWTGPALRHAHTVPPAGSENSGSSGEPTRKT
jgi:hypothetical protein